MVFIAVLKLLYFCKTAMETLSFASDVSLDQQPDVATGERRGKEEEEDEVCF